MCKSKQGNLRKKASPREDGEKMCGEDSMKFKRHWQKRFAKKILHEIKCIEKNPFIKLDERNHRIDTIKDVLFLMGVSVDKDLYNYAKGYDKFCEDFGVPELKGR